MKVRLSLNDRGNFSIHSEPLVSGRRKWNVMLASQLVNSGNKFLYHKTTNRRMYESVGFDRELYQDILFRNQAGELTESTIANIVIRRGGELLTPPVSSGLLPGVYREYLLAQKRIKEQRLTVQDLESADAVYLINSVRGWVSCQLNVSRPDSGNIPG
jgi:para-aminobenzoate synthetase/4-amino-4-deoxychorismate lyase